MTADRPAVTRWVGVATALALLSLGLPWSTGTDWNYWPGVYIPGSCYTVYDYAGYAGTECTTGYTNFGWWTAGSPGIDGASHPVRVFILAATALALWALRSGRTARLRAAVGLEAVGFLAFGVHAVAGQLCFGLAVAALVLAVRATGEGVLPRSRVRPPTPSPAAPAGSSPGR